MKLLQNLLAEFYVHEFVDQKTLIMSIIVIIIQQEKTWIQPWDVKKQTNVLQLN